MVKVSIVIPIYNTEKYIRSCLNSVICQTLREIEIICINDGSTDNSFGILKEYVVKDRRFKVINNTTNLGVTISRIIGLEAAIGEYIFYLDSDDWIDNNYIERLYYLADESNVDVVLGAMTYVWENRSEKLLNKLGEGLYVGKEEISTFIDVYDIDKKEVIQKWNICGNLFCRDKYYKHQIKVDERIKIGEDMAVFIPFILDSEKIYVTNIASYYYRQHCASAMHNNSSKTMDYYYLWEYLKPYLIDKKNTMQQIAHICCTGIENDYVSLLNLKQQNFYMFPYELIPPHSRIIIFGAGLVGQAYYRQIVVNNYCTIELIVDNNYKMNNNKRYPVVPPSFINNSNYDYILIALINEQLVENIKNQLLCVYEVPKDNIISYVPKMITDFIDFGW